MSTGGEATGPLGEVGGVIPPGELGGVVPPGELGGVVPPGELGGVVPPGELGGVVPPGELGGVVPPGAGVPDCDPFGLPLFGGKEGLSVRPVGIVLAPTANRPNCTTDPCCTVCEITAESPAPRFVGITSVLPLDASGSRGNRASGAGTTHWKA